MNIWENAVVTTKGLSLLSKLIEGDTLKITKGETGEGYVTPGLLSQMTAVSNPKQTLSLRKQSYPEEGKCRLPCYLTNDGVTTGYTVKQVGVYATDPDEGEILFLIVQAPSDKGTIVPSETEMPGYSAEWSLYFQYGQADGVSVIVDPSNAATYADLNEINKQKEDKANRTETIDDTANNTTYPTSKAVKAYVDGVSEKLQEEIEKKADDNSALKEHISDSEKHVTSAEKSNWNDKYTKEEVDAIRGAIKVSETVESIYSNFVYDQNGNPTTNFDEVHTGVFRYNDDTCSYLLFQDKFIDTYYDNGDISNWYHVYQKIFAMDTIWYRVIEAINPSGDLSNATFGTGKNYNFIPIDELTSKMKERNLSANMGRVLNEKITAITPDYGTEDLEAGVTALATGKMYLVYE